jgi:hypothetical protein
MTPKRLTQQSIEPQVGEYMAGRNCAPTCFFILGRAGGYLKDGIGSTLGGFTTELNWDQNFSEARGWVRPALAAELRQRYGMAIVSWQLNGNIDPDLELMQRSGYLSSDREIEFFKEHIIGQELPDIIQNTYPVMVGVKRGFGGEADSTHAIILSSWEHGKVTVVDPDDRNTKQVYDEAYVLDYLNPTGGGCTIVLPKED